MGVEGDLQNKNREWITSLSKMVSVNSAGSSFFELAGGRPGGRPDRDEVDRRTS